MAICTWTGQSATTNNFSDAANWLRSGLPGVPQPGDQLVFQGSARTTPVNNLTVTTSFASIQFAASNFTVTGNTLALTEGVVVDTGVSTATIGLRLSLSGTCTITVAGGSLVGSGAISGTGGMVKAGTGTLTLSGSNTYSGGTIVSGGVLEATTPAALPGRVSAVGGALLLNSPSGTWTTAIDGGGTVRVQLGAGGTTATLTGDLSGFTGVLDVLPYNSTSGGKLRLGGASAYPSAAATVKAKSGATVWVSQGGDLASTIQLYGGSLGEGYGQLRLDNGARVTGHVVLMADTSIGSFSGTGTIAGPISDDGGSRALAKVGGGTIVLAGGNSFTGRTTVSSGVLHLGDGVSTNASLSGPVVTNSTLVIANPFPQEIATAITGPGGLRKTGPGTLTLTGASTYTGTTTVSAGTLAIGNGGTSGSLASPIANASVVVFDRSNDATFAKAISGTGTLRKRGAGTLTLSGINPFAGRTEVEAGVLNVTGALKASAVVTSGGGSLLGVAASAQLAVDGLTAGSPSDVWVTWTPATGRSSAVPYQVLDGGAVIDTVLVNQSQPPVGKMINGTRYQKLGTYVPTASGLSVRILSQPNGTIDSGALVSESSATLPPRRFHRVSGVDFRVGETGSPITTNNVAPAFSGWMDAGSWQSAVMRAVGGTFSITGRNGNPDFTFTFPEACSIGYAAEFMNARGNDLAAFGVAPDRKLVVFEDWTDFDMDDDYWLPAVAEGTPTVNLDTDSNNDGSIHHAVDDPIETSAPGRLVAVREHARDPLATVQIDPIGLSTWVSGNIMATLSASNTIRVYADAAGTQLLFPAGSTSRTWDAATEPLPTNVYVGGLTAGAASLTWSVSVDGYPINDSVAFTAVPPVDLDVDSNNDGAIDPDNGPAGPDDPIEAQTNLPGVIVPVGGEWVPLIVNVPKFQTATLAFDATPGERVRVYSPAGALALDGTHLSTTVEGGTAQTFWIEAVAPSASMADIALTLTTTGSGPASSDTILATAVEVDLDVDSDNDGTIDPDNGPAGKDDRIEEGTNDEGVIVRPGVIVPVGGGRVKMVANVPQGMTATLAFANGVGKVEVYAQETGGEPVLEDERNKKTTTVVGGSPQTFWIEANAPSESMADIAFTLTLNVGTGSGSAGTGSTGAPPSDTTRATAVAVDLDVDELPDDREDIGAGAIVWRNSDFSRLLPDPDPAKRDAEPGLRRYAPDYSDSRAIDPEYASQFTPGRATFTPSVTDWFDFQFVFDATKIVLWTRESWVGFDEVAAEPDGWWKIPAGKSVRPGPGDNGDRIDFWIEGLASTGYGNKELELLTLPKPGNARPLVPPPDVVKFTVVDVGLGVDGNRDGTIDFADSHDRQLTFWLNDDSEKVDDPWTGSPYESENPLYGPGRTKDSGDRSITKLRDLEDFASLHFLADENLGQMIHAPDGGADSLRPTYRYRLSLASADTQIRLFQNRPQAESLAHVSDVAAARNLLRAPIPKSLHAAEPDIDRGLTVLTSLVPSAADDRFRYLFEAFGEPGRAALEFTVTVTYPEFGGVSGGTRWPRTTSRTHTLDLDLRDIKDLYTRMQVPYRIAGRDDRFTHFVPGTTDDLPHFGAAQPLHSGNTQGIPFLSGTETVVLVHGWDMTDGTQTSGPNTDWKRAFTETAFKRLYWQGLRGNVTAFDWPTFADQEGEIRDFLAKFNFSYNASEFQAFRSGRSLMTFLADKKATGPVHVLAHSMGNVVAAEALRQWTVAGNGQALVNNYVAMQGALSAGAYGDDARDAVADGSGHDYYRHWPSGFRGEGRYYMEGTDQAAGRWINMFNEVDRATSAEFGWGANNRVKPMAGGIWRDVVPGTPMAEARRFAYRINSSGKLIRSYADDITGIPVTDGEVELAPGLVAPGPGQLPGPAAYEVLAFMSKANAKPIGTKEVLFFERNGTNIDIQSLGLSDTYVDEWPGHSFQFHFDAATTSQFWKRVVDKTRMDTVSKPRSP